MKTTLLKLTQLICLSLAPSILHADDTSSWCTSDITVLTETVAPKVTGFWAGINGGGVAASAFCNLKKRWLNALF